MQEKCIELSDDEAATCKVEVDLYDGPDVVETHEPEIDESVIEIFVCL